MANFGPTAEGESCPFCRTGPFYRRTISISFDDKRYHSYTCNCGECLVVGSIEEELKTKWAEAVATASFMKIHDTF